jgi:hypothetical protein
MGEASGSKGPDGFRGWVPGTIGVPSTKAHKKSLPRQRRAGRLKQLRSNRSLDPAPQLTTPAEGGGGAEEG